MAWCLFIYEHGFPCTLVHVWRSEDKLRGQSYPSIFFFLRWGLLLFTVVSASRSYRHTLPHQTLRGCWAVSASRSARITDVHFHIGLYVDAGHLNSDFHPWTVSLTHLATSLLPLMWGLYWEVLQGSGGLIWRHALEQDCYSFLQLTSTLPTVCSMLSKQWTSDARITFRDFEFPVIVSVA